MKNHELEKVVRELIGSPLPDAEVRQRLEELARKERNFSGFTWLWGPALYARNRVLFCPFILGHFGTWLISDLGFFSAQKWSGKVGHELQPWLEEVDRRDDVALYLKLSAWKYSELSAWNSGQKRMQVIAPELLDRLRRAETPAARQIVLRKFDHWFTLDAETAFALYEADPVATPQFILRRIPTFGWTGEKRVLWETLLQATIDRGDEDFRWKIYRRMVPLKQWHADVLALSRTIQDVEKLDVELEKHHPEGWNLKVGDTFLELLKARGRDVLPYISRHLVDMRNRWSWIGRDSSQKLWEFAAEKGWWEFWAALVRVAARPQEFDSSVMDLVKNEALPETEIVRRLRLLAGVSREWNWGGFGLAAIHNLTDATATALYARFPELLRGPFRQHVQASTWGAKYDCLMDAVILANDETMIDFLASRFITRIPHQWGNQAKLVAEAEKLSHYYEGMRHDEALFTRRAAAVLGQVPAYSIWDYNRLLRENRLARLLFERSAKSFLGDVRSMGDLVEAPEIHVQALAYRALGLDDDRARTLAAANLPILMGTLLRPLHRTTRTLAFGALTNAATTLENARAILTRAREAMSLPDTRYPKDRLLTLMATLLHRWPELREAGEVPTVYERAA